jgi:hypothetical protein
MALSIFALNEKLSPDGVVRVKSGARQPVRGPTQGSDGDDVLVSGAHETVSVNESKNRRNIFFFIFGSLLIVYEFFAPEASVICHIIC